MRAALLGLCAASTLACAQAPIVAAYLPDYRLEQFSAEQAEGLTDLLLFSVRPDLEGHVRDPGGLLTRLARVAPAQRHWRVLLSVGGGGQHRSDAFSTVAADPPRRSRFIGELVALVSRAGLDGVDLDWEHFKDVGERRALATLLVELHQALSPRHLLLTVAVADPAVLLPEAVAAVDRIHLMAYDGPAHGSLAQARALVELALAQQIPAAKLCLGLPLYAVERDGGATTSYRELILRPPEEPDGLLISGAEPTRTKVRWLKTKKLGGVFFWELTQDAPGEASLINLVRGELGR